jgi:phosphohistidine phosphatase SixA
VRHADIDPTVELATDPPLTERGRLRAELLADFLANVDVVSGVDAIYATSAKRTQQTAAPLAGRLGQRLNIDDPYQVDRLVRRLFRDRKGKITLVVADADVIPRLVAELHGKNPLPPFGPNDYSELYIVTVPYYGKVKTLRFHYAELPAEPSVTEDSTKTSFSAPP